jgi:CTP:phosphocholine cytidylyltransferase-like protein|tara:strand:+ start:1035 stop:1472 length:438 start_codon:yes stop_codon:yes gene_type:complete
MTNRFEELKQKALNGEMDYDTEGSVALMIEVGKLPRTQRWEIGLITYNRLNPEQKIKELNMENIDRVQYFDDLMNWEPNGEINSAIKEATERLESKEWLWSEVLYSFARRVRDFVLESNYIYEMKERNGWYSFREANQLESEMSE